MTYKAESSRMEAAFRHLPGSENNLLGLTTSPAAPRPEKNQNRQKGRKRSSVISLKHKLPQQQQPSGNVPGHGQLDAKRLLSHKAGAIGYKTRPKLEGNFVPKNSVMRMRAGKRLEAELPFPDTTSQASFIVFII